MLRTIQQINIAKLLKRQILGKSLMKHPVYYDKKLIDLFILNSNIDIWFSRFRNILYTCILKT